MQSSVLQSHMETIITVIIVLFNKRIMDSVTCKNILNIDSREDIKIIIVDNSTRKNDNELYCKKFGMQYISMHGNKGLSKAYNEAIQSNRKTGIYVFFDDDTEITSKYFSCLREAAITYPDIDIFAPIIFGPDKIIYSPNESHFMKNHLIANRTEEINQKKFNAIASCLAVRSNVFYNYCFNEQLFVDQIDQNFFDDQRALGRTFMKLDVDIVQNFYQRGVGLTSEAGWSRLRLRIVDIFRYARLKDKSVYVILAFVKCCGLGVQIGKKTHSISVPLNAIKLSASCFINKNKTLTN